jgi:hypothetical protein
MDEQHVESVVKLKANQLSWYQTESRVVVTLLGRHLKELALDAEQLDVVMGEQHVELVDKKVLEGSKKYRIDFNQLIDRTASSVKTINGKVELSLAKVSSVHWPTLEGTNSGSPPLSATVPLLTSATGTPLAADEQSLVPSKKPAKNWDKLVKELEAEEENSEEQDVNSVFKKLYAGADEATRRAMNKSYSQSGGKALSMNWAEVGKTEYKYDGDKYKSDEEEDSSTSSEDDEGQKTTA